MSLPADLLTILGLTARAAMAVWPDGDHPGESLEQAWRRLYGPERVKPLGKFRIGEVEVFSYSRARFVLRYPDGRRELYQGRVAGAAPTRLERRTGSAGAVIREILGGLGEMFGGRPKGAP